MLILACDEPHTSSGPFLNQELSALLLESSSDGVGSAFGPIWFGHIIDARLLPRSNKAVVLDFGPPYIHVIDFSTSSHLNFGADGEGPGELRRPGFAAPNGTSLLAVGHGSIISVFTPDGEYSGQLRLPFRPVAATRGCLSDDWLVFGRDAHRYLLARMYPTAPTDFAIDTLTTYDDVVMEGAATRQFLGRSADEVVVFLEQTRPPRIVHLSCPYPLTTKVVYDFSYDDPGTAEEIRYSIRAGTESVAADLISGEPWYGGVGLIGRHTLMFAFAKPDLRSSAADHTLIHSLHDGTVASIAVRGAFTIADTDDGTHVLLITRDSVPRVFRFPKAVLDARFADMPRKPIEKSVQQARHVP